MYNTNTYKNKLTIVSRSLPNHESLTSIPTKQILQCHSLPPFTLLLLLGHRSGLRAVRIKDTHLFDSCSAGLGVDIGPLPPLPPPAGVDCVSLT